MTSSHENGCFRTGALAAIALLAAVYLTESSARAAPPFRAEPQAVQETESPLPVFDLHSGFWVNLHHFLYLQARLSKENSSSTDNARGEAPPNEPPASVLDFPADEIKAWQDAVAFYAKDLAGRDLLLNGDMETINNQLSAMEICADLEGKSSPKCNSGLRKDLIEALERAAPVYRAHWWAEHDRANRAWIAQVAPMVQKMGVGLSGPACRSVSAALAG